MKTIYVLTKKAHGPCGHGEPGEPYLCLAHDGEWYAIGTPRPAFTNEEDAETYRKTFDTYNFYKVTPVELR